MTRASKNGVRIVLFGVLLLGGVALTTKYWRSVHRVEQRQSSASIKQVVAGSTIPGTRQSANTVDTTLRGRDEPQETPTAGKPVPTPASAMLHPEDDLAPQAAIGRPFPVSQAVERGWKYAPPDPIVTELLEKFAQEERDVSWAQRIEAHLSALFPTPLGTAARSIECRTSICILEVTYTGQADYSAYSDPYLLSQIHLESEAFGYETDATNLRIKILLEIYKRDQ